MPLYPAAWQPEFGDESAALVEDPVVCLAGLGLVRSAQFGAGRETTILTHDNVASRGSETSSKDRREGPSARVDTATVHQPRPAVDLGGGTGLR